MNEVKLIAILFLLISFTNRCVHANEDLCSFKIGLLRDGLKIAANKLDSVSVINTQKAGFSKTRCLDLLFLIEETYSNLGMKDSALKYCSEIISIDSGNLIATTEMGILYDDANLYDSSLAYFFKALKIKTKGRFIVDVDPKWSAELKTEDVSGLEIVYFIGLNYYYSRRLKNASYYFDYCIKQEYRLDNAYFFKGAINIETHNFQQACHDFENAKLYGNMLAESYLLKY